LLLYVILLRRFSQVLEFSHHIRGVYEQL
jgi:hypothetical protein